MHLIVERFMASRITNVSAQVILSNAEATRQERYKLFLGTNIASYGINTLPASLGSNITSRVGPGHFSNSRGIFHRFWT